MRLRNLGLIGGLLACFGWLTASAQHTDRSFTTTSKDCSGLHWSESALKQYPNLASACQSVEEHDGVTYVKFSATVLRARNHGKELTLAVKDGGDVTVAMPAETELSINGRVTPISNLQRGDQLNFYVPENRLAAQFYAENQTPAQAAPTIVAPFEPTVTERREQVAERLPGSASEFPLFALSGFVLLGFGAGLTALRLRHR